MDNERLKSLTKNEIATASKGLNADEIDFLFQRLEEKDDKLRYNAFLLLQAISQETAFLYKYWNELEKKLESNNSYQRSLGIMLLSENVRWDKKGLFDKTIDRYMVCCNDEKFITARQTIQGLEAIIKSTDKYDNIIKQTLTNTKFAKYKENQQNLLNKDKEKILKIIEKQPK